MNLDTLDELSRDFALNLFARYPEWQAFARTARRPEDAEDHLIVEVPVLKGDAHPLAITTENGEVTVHFDYCHSHFDWPVTDMDAAYPVTDMEAAYNVDPFVFIASILDEKLATISCWDGDEWQSSWWLEQGEDPNEGAPMSTSRVRVRSWRGSRNYDFDLSRD